MNPVERFQAAIEKLEALRKAAFAGKWSSFHTGVAGGDHSFVVDGGGEVILSVSANDGSDEELRAPTADLVVTLYRTIDAQLDTLREAIKNEAVRRSPRLWSWALESAGLAIANAILGEDS